MDKKLILISLILIILVIITAYLLIPTQIDEKKILDIIKPKIEEYCIKLNNQSINSGCPTCRINSYNNTKTFSNSLDIVEYIIKKEGSGYKISIRIPTIYGQNTRTGEAKIIFDLDKNYNIISDNNPALVGCL